MDVGFWLNMKNTFFLETKIAQHKFIETKSISKQKKMLNLYHLFE